MQPIPFKVGSSGMKIAHISMGGAMFFASLTLTSCEGNTRQVYSVRNDSTGPLVVVHASTSYGLVSERDTVVVPAGTVQQLGQEDWLGGREEPSPPTTFIDTISVTDANGAPTTKNWQSMDAWEVVSTEDRKVPSQMRHEFTFAVSYADF